MGKRWERLRLSIDPRETRCDFMLCKDQATSDRVKDNPINLLA